MTPVHRGSALIVTCPSLPLRRELGPVMWAVLEDLVLDSDAGHASPSARRIAARLGMTPGGAAVALARLRRRQLLALEPPTVDRFGLAGYALAPVDGLFVVAELPVGLVDGAAR